MKIISYLGLLGGLVILGVLMAWSGISEVLDLLLVSGWKLLLLPIVWFPTLIFAAWSWRLLFDATQAPAFSRILAAIWMGRSINTLLPVATIGGEIAKARLITIWGCRGTVASSTVIVDKTVQALALIPWGIVGVLMLLAYTSDHQLLLPAIAGFSLLGFGIAGFIFVQRSGMFGSIANILTRFSHAEKWPNISDHAREIDQQILDIYNNRQKFLSSVAVRSLSLALETTEIWLGCYLLGQNISLVDAIMLKSLVSSLNNIAFVVPNAYGIQEGGFIVFGTLLGFTPEFTLALSLATRLRELMIDLPGLLYWQVFESRRLIKRRAANAS